MNVRLLRAHQLCVLRLRLIVFTLNGSPLQTGIQLAGNEDIDINVMVKFIQLYN